MSIHIDIYDSEGRPYGGGTRDERVSEMFFADVRFAVEDQGREVECAFYFRARESAHGRAEQFFAVCRADSVEAFFRSLRSELESAASGHGLSVQRGEGVLDTFEGVSMPSLDDFEHRVALDRLNRGTDLGFGVYDESEALGLALAYYSEGVRSVAVSGSSSTDSTSTPYRLLLRYGESGSFTPLDEQTKRAMEQGRQSMEGELVRNAVGDIEDAVRRVTSQTSVSSNELRRRVHERVPELKSPSGGVGGGGNDFSLGDDSLGGSDDGKLKDALIAVGAGLAVLLVVAVVAVAVTTFTGYAIPGVPDLGGGSPAFGDVSAEWGENAIAFEGNVTNATDGTNVTATLDPEGLNRTTEVAVTNETFSGTFDASNVPANESHRIRFSVGGATTNATVGSDASEATTPTPEPTATPTPTETPSPTETEVSKDVDAMKTTSADASTETQTSTDADTSTESTATSTETQTSTDTNTSTGTAAAN